ncbi:MAG: hypothetical protein DI582_09605 [Azospirillum brasilense]|nr:MAG: hypothetical protein DI582_09605 [Azospirillum brasilense]
MSSPQTGNKLTGDFKDTLERNIAWIIATALRKDYGEKRHAIKRIARAVPVDSLNTIKSWYEGRNPPNSVHLILLARHSPSVAHAVAALLGTEATGAPMDGAADTTGRKSKTLAMESISTATSFGINMQLQYAWGGKLTVRQLWFVGLLQHGYRMRASHIVHAWDISRRTAETDIAKLIAAGIIRFNGARKNGAYEICAFKQAA